MDGRDIGSADPALVAQLVAAGLSDREARLYLTVLAVTDPTVSEIARLLGTNRTGVYDTVRSLEQKSLVQLVDSDRVSHRSGTKVLRAADPTMLLARHRRDGLTLERLVPELRRLSVHNEPHAQYFQGVYAMRTALLDILDWGCPLRGILSMRDLYETVGRDAMDTFIAERARRGMSLRVVRSRERDEEGEWPTSDHDQRILRRAPTSYVFTSSMYIGDENILLLSSPAEAFALKLSSRQFALTQQHLFELLWTMSEPA